MNLAVDMRLPPRLQRLLLAPVVACLASLPVAACTGQYPDDTPMGTSPDATTDAPPLRNLNPTPRRAFEIKVTLDDAPGPFVSVEAVAQFDVQNPGACGEPSPVLGVIPRITSNEPVALSKVSDVEYTGTLYLDQILDEDYYGRGVCRWALVVARVRLRGADDELGTRFVASLPEALVTAEGVERTSFWKGYYPRATMTNYATFGHTDLEHVPAEKRDEFFAVTMSARERQP